MRACVIEPTINNQSQLINQPSLCARCARECCGGPALLAPLGTASPRTPLPRYVSPWCVCVGGCVSIVGVLVHRGCVCPSCLRLRSGWAPRAPSWAPFGGSALNGDAWGPSPPCGLASALRPFALGPAAPPRPVLGSLRSLRFKRGRGGAALPSAFGRMNVCA